MSYNKKIDVGPGIQAAAGVTSYEQVYLDQ